MNKTFVKNSPSDLTVQGCIDNLPAGNYRIYVYDVENDIPLTSILPAIILRDIVITDISTTSKLYNILLHYYYEHYGMCSMIIYLTNCNVLNNVVTMTTPINTVDTTLSTTLICKYIV